MSINLTFLGTSSMVPTKDRNHSSIYLDYDGEGILFDCGEGTQRQIKSIGLKPSKITKLIISHWHGDHTLGIPGLINTMGNSDYMTGTVAVTLFFVESDGSGSDPNRIDHVFAL